MILNIFLFLTMAPFSSSAIGLNALQAVAPSASNQETRDYAAEVNLLMDNILSRGETHIGDVVATTWIPPSEDDLNIIRSIGIKSIPPLDKALDSKAPFRQFLAVRLLGTVGGADIVPPLQRVLRPNVPNSVRLAALTALRAAPDSLAIPIVRQYTKDQDPLVAERAQALLVDYYKVPIAEN